MAQQYAIIPVTVIKSDCHMQRLLWQVSGCKEQPGNLAYLRGGECVDGRLLRNAENALASP